MDINKNVLVAIKVKIKNNFVKSKFCIFVTQFGFLFQRIKLYCKLLMGKLSAVSN